MAETNPVIFLTPVDGELTVGESETPTGVLSFGTKVRVIRRKRDRDLSSLSSPFVMAFQMLHL